MRSYPDSELAVPGRVFPRMEKVNNWCNFFRALYRRDLIVPFEVCSISAISIIGTDSNIEDSIMTQIYDTYNNQAAKEGINEVPLVFDFRDLPELTNRAVPYRPMLGGVQLWKEGGLQWHSTSGFSAKRMSDHWEGYVVTGHIGPFGTKVYQPTLSYPAGTVNKVGGRYSDSAFVPLGENGSNKVTGLIYWNYPYWKIVTTYRNPNLGDGVFMSGNASGVTYGTVSEIKSIWNPYFKRFLPNQVLASYYCQDGDSGSPIFMTLSGDNATLYIGMKITPCTLKLLQSCYPD